MHKVFRIIILLTILLGFIACDSKQTVEKQTIVVEVLPFPNKVLKRGGTITLSSDFWVIANVSDSVSSDLAAYLVKNLNRITGKEAGITDLYSTRKHTESVRLELDNNTPLTSSESYTLDITSSHIKIKAKSAKGIYYGIQTLLQLLESGANNSSYVIPKIVIKDSPNFSVRGIAIKQSQLNSLSSSRFIQLLGALKINAVFVIADADQDRNIMAESSKNYLKMYSGSEIPSDIMLISYGPSSEELAETYNTADLSSVAKGIVLDLTSTTNEDLLPKLSVLAELSWSDKDKHDFARLQKLQKLVLSIK
jgi:hexosaminidase